MNLSPQVLAKNAWSSIKKANDGFNAEQLAALRVKGDSQRERGEVLIERLLARKFSQDQLKGALLTLRGVDAATIKLLTAAEQLDLTVALLARGRVDTNKQFLTHQGAELALEMVRDAIAAERGGSSPEIATQPSKILRTMTTYEGSPAELREFVYTLGAKGIGKGNQTLNPFMIASQVEVVYPLYTTDEAARKTTGATVQHPYQLERPTQAPGQVYLAGQQAVMTILGTFGGETFSREKRAETSTRRVSESNAFLASVRLVDLMNPETAAQVARASRLLARHTQVAQELQQYIDALRTAVGKLEQTVAPSAPLSKVFGYEGGSLWNRIKAKKDLPPSVKIALGLLEDPLYSTTVEERKTLRLAIVAYGLMHLQFVGSGLLTGYDQDLALLGREVAMSSSSPSAIAQVTPQQLAIIKERLNQAQQQRELSVKELGDIVELLTPVTEYRRSRNMQEITRYQVSVAAVVKLGKQLFQRNGAWLADSVGEEVPMGRLSNHILSQKFARVAGSTRDGAVLSRADYGAIRALTRIALLAATPEAQAVAYPVDKFAETLHAAVVATRKVESVANQISEKDPARVVRFINSLGSDEQMQAAELKSFKIVVLPPKHLLPAEAFEQGYGMPIEALISRFDYVRGQYLKTLTSATYYKRIRLARGIQAHAKKANLAVDVPGFLEISKDHEAVRQAQALVPVADLSHELNCLQSLQRYNHFNSNFFRGLPQEISATWHPLIRPTYMYPAAAARVRQLAQVLAPVRESFTRLEQAQVVERIRASRASQFPPEFYATVLLPDGSSVAYLDATRYLGVDCRAA